jgi:hypothetical protein
MQKIFTTLFLIFSLASYGQQGMWKPFKLLIVQPDTAVIEKSLYSDSDSVVATQLNRYYSFIKQQEGILDCEGCDSSIKEQIRKDLPLLKAQEPEVKKFKYFQTLSSYSTEVYNFYFNEYEPYSTIIEIPNQKTDLATLSKTADTSKADYIVFFDNVHTTMQDGLPILKLTTSLYAKKENKIIFSKETEGDANSRGDMWTCNMNVMLSCLLINGVRTSTDEVADILRKRQIRK